ncbi:hypothetical protein ACFUIV_31300 [Streptomyces anulatus]|uniref:hypothetical protein n=1 Tax=Streptomyces anulatus TaxID=1892 RepID=UPI003636CBA6
MTGVPGAVVMFSAAGNAARVVSLAGRTIAMGRSRAAETASASCHLFCGYVCGADQDPRQWFGHVRVAGLLVDFQEERSEVGDDGGHVGERPDPAAVPRPTVMISVWSVHPHVPASSAIALPTARTSSAVPSRSSAPVCRKSASSRSPFSVAPRVTSPG